jgi:NADH-quinone oxidoreductase subunit I
MPIASNEVRWVEPPKVGLVERLYLPAIFAGLGTTAKHLFMPRLTVQFPEQ